MIATYLPWLLSAITIYMTYLAGNKNKWAWLIGLVSQELWLVWIWSVAAWGLVPMNLALQIIYFRNFRKWRKKESKGIKEIVDQLTENIRNYYYKNTHKASYLVLLEVVYKIVKTKIELDLEDFLKKSGRKTD